MCLRILIFNKFELNFTTKEYLYYGITLLYFTSSFVPFVYIAKGYKYQKVILCFDLSKIISLGDGPRPHSNNKSRNKIVLR